jgi:hypothetical protein
MVFSLFFKNQIKSIPNLDLGSEFKLAQEEIKDRGSGASVVDMVFIKCVNEFNNNLICKNKFINSLIIQIFEKSIKKAIKSSFKDCVRREQTVAIARLIERLEGPRKLKEFDAKIRESEEKLKELELKQEGYNGKLSVTVTKITEHDEREGNFNKKFTSFLENTKDEKRGIELNSAIAQLNEIEEKEKQFSETKSELGKIGIEIGSLKQEVESLKKEATVLRDKITSRRKEEASHEDAILLLETVRMRAVIENRDKIREILIRNKVLVESKNACYGKEIDLTNAANNSKNVIASVKTVCFEGG